MREKRRARYQRELAALRTDTAKTAARYDEILHLRMLLLDVLDDVDSSHDDDEGRIHVSRATVEQIRRDAKRYGRKGDCV